MSTRNIGRRMRRRYSLPQEISALRAGVPIASVHQARRARHRLEKDPKLSDVFSKKIRTTLEENVGTMG